MFFPPRSGFRRRRRATDAGDRSESLLSRGEHCAAIVVLAAIVLLAGVLALGAELDDRKRAFRLEAHNASLQISRQLAEGQTLVAALHGFYQSSGAISSAHFPQIAQNFLRSHPQVRWIAYAEQVPAGADADFEHRMRREGYVGLRIHPLDQDATLAPGEPRLPFVLLEPLTPLSARAIGADVLGHAAWEAPVRDAIATGAVHALHVAGPGFDSDGFALLRATYRGNVEPDEAAARRHQLSGMLVVFLDERTLLRSITTSDQSLKVSLARAHAAVPTPNDVGIQVFDATGEWRPRIAMELRLPLADLPLVLSVDAALRPDPGGVIAAMLLALLAGLSLLHGLRLRRLATRRERASFEQAQLAEVTLHSIGEAVVRLDERGRVRYMNPVAELMTGIGASDARGAALERVFRLTDSDGRTIPGTAVSRLQQTDGPLLVTAASGRRRPVACTVSGLEDTRGRGSGHVLVLRDVSREHELSRELAYQASHDPLTNLPNRRTFEQRLSNAIDSAQCGDGVHSLCYVDLDQFKVVNDTCGHAAGDQMLRQIAGLLGSEVRDRDVLARLGGDEFGVLLSDCPVDRALGIAERICGVVADFRFHWDDRAFVLGASIGVVEINRACGSVDDVQRAADLACYAAKDTGRNRVHLFRHEDRVISRNHREMQWHAEIKEALEDGRFALHGQEIRRLDPDAQPARLCEFLLRMIGRDAELIPPMAFLPAAERYGLMTALDRAVICQAFEHIATSGRRDTLYTINLSGQSLADVGLVDYVLDTIAVTGADPRQVCFEITETSAISNLTQAVQLIERLRARSFRFALDDFGAGLSSFAYLKQLPVDFLKIDGQFIRDINEDAVARAMVTSIISVARVLELKTIAEKVEDEGAELCLRALGVDYVQGWHVARPMPIDHPLPVARSA